MSIQPETNELRVNGEIIEREELTRTSPYDNSISFLYKQAIRLSVPVRFVLIAPRTDAESEFVDFFDLDENRDAIFTTIFDFIRRLFTQGPEQTEPVTLTQIWDIVSKFRGDTFNHLELIFMWLHALPEYRVENAELLAQVNTFLSNLNEPHQYNNMTEIINEYINTWLPRYEQEFQDDIQTLRGYIQTQQEINEIRPVAHSNITLDAVSIVYEYPTEVNINPLPDIFNAAQTSYVVPFIQYNITPIKGQPETAKRYYKIYKGRSVDARPNYNNVVLPTTQASGGQAIYLNVWTGSEDGDAQEEARTSKKESFNLVTISYKAPTQPNESGIIRVYLTSPHTEEINENIIINRIHSHLRALPRPTDVNEVRIRGSFNIYNVNLVKLILFHLITNDPVFSNYLFLKEKGKSFAEKTRLNIQYRGASTYVIEPTKTKKRKTETGSAISATIAQHTIPRGEVFIVENPDGTLSQHTSDRDIDMLTIRMTRASSRRAAEQFVNILSRFFRRYVDQGPAILNEYLTFVPEYRQVLEETRPPRTPGVAVAPPSVIEGQIVELPEIEKPIKLLQRYAPDLFMSGYARKCQRPAQPIPINPEEIEVWREKRILNEQGQYERRQILKIPEDNPRYFFVCPHDDRPYPGLQENTTASRDKYPYVPCCFKRNQEISDTSRLNQSRQGINQVPATPSRSTHIYTSNKMATPGRRGIIPTAISSFLSSYDENAGEFFRYGVPRSTNSFIHCVLLALEYQPYLDSSDREAYVSTLRENLFNPTVGLRSELLKQELYDMLDEDIIQVTTDNDQFFDPLLFYRAMETLFNCNIYVLAQTDKDHETGLEMSLLQLPRHKYFHARVPTPGRPVILIDRHWGTESNALEYPQCELIVDWRTDESERFIEMRASFSESMNLLLFPALTFVGRTLTWQIIGSVGENRTPQLTCRMNVYSSFNYELIFGQIPIIGQVIDSAGKARMFALAPEYTDRSTWANPNIPEYSPLRIFVNIPPTAPLNVPQFFPRDASTSLPPYQKVIELLGNPISATQSTDETLLTGLWFPVGDIQFGFYCPCQESSWSEFLQLYPDINRRSELAALTVHVPRRVIERTPIQRMRMLRRSSRFIQQIIEYLYLVAGQPDIDEFLNQILIMLNSQGRPDSADIYDLSQLPRILPLGDDPETIITALSTYNPQVFIQGRILVYDNTMLKGIRYQLWRFVKIMAGIDMSHSQLRELREYYATKEDFDFDPRTEFLLASFREFNSWTQIYILSSNIEQRRIQNLKDNIQTQLNPNVFTYQEPYIFQKSETALVTSYDPRSDRFYLIQNVAGGEFRRAIQVAYTWYIEKRNLGFAALEYQTAPGEEGLLPAHIVYRISPNGGIMVKQNNSGGQDRALEILDYGNNSYAAMLPIL